MNFKQRVKNGIIVYGMACFTGNTAIIECIAQSGLDFVYLDLEHTNYMLDEAFEKQIMAAKLHDIAILVRVADENEVVIRKVLEWGADGVVIPHCKNKDMVKAAVGAAKFFPLGRRGGESIVRASGFGYQNFDWNRYMKQQNEDTLVIPMDEDFEFTENMDEILSVEGIDAVNFGPVDYANSLDYPLDIPWGRTSGKPSRRLLPRRSKKAASAFSAPSFLPRLRISLKPLPPAIRC